MKENLCLKKLFHLFPFLGILTGCLLLFILAILANNSNQEKITDIIKKNVPLTPDKFQIVFDALSFQTSVYGQSILHCKFEERQEGQEEYESMSFIGIMKVVDVDASKSPYPVWTQIFYDEPNKQLCYYLHANQIKSSLKCEPQRKASAFFFDLERICFIYSSKATHGWDIANSL